MAGSLLVSRKQQGPFDFAQGRLSRDTAALGMTKSINEVYE